MFIPFTWAQVQTEIIEHAQTTDVVFTFEPTVTPHVFYLKNPARVVIDLQPLHDTQLAFDISKLPIQQIRTGQQADHQLRIVLDLLGDVDVSHTLTETAVMIHLPVVNTPQTAPIPALRDVVVVLDPGHGGRDPGAIGPHGSLEKNIVLAIARELKQLLEQEPGIRVVLTREGDCYFALRERLAIAREYNADVFVSLHADAFKNSSARGASVFALSSGGATSEAAHWLAEQERYSELGGADISDLDNPMVRSVLLDLSQTATIGASLQLGTAVLENLQSSSVTLHSSRVEQAGFVVLKSPDIPSILIETGFISNPTEELNLGSKAYRQQLAQLIFAGLKTYVWEQAPQGSYIYAWLNTDDYEVVSGDSLSAIARRHRVTVAELKNINHLQNDIIRIGQQLKIPNRSS